MNKLHSTLDLIEFASGPAFGVDANMRITGWNEGAEALLGYSYSEAFGRSCGHVLQASYSTGEPLCSVACKGSECFSKGQKWSVESCKVRHKNGKFIPAEISTLVLPRNARKNAAGETVSIIFIHPSHSEENDISAGTLLNISSLGKFRLSLDGKELNIEKWKRKQALTILKCLVCQLDKPVHRERLMEWLWPEVDSVNGWKRLKVTISYLRAELRKGGLPEDIIETVGQSYLLRSEAVWVDSSIFCSRVATGWKLLKEGDLSNALGQFEEAENLYRGNFFEDEPYAEWCAVERERLLEIYLELLAGMENCYSQQGSFLEAVRVCQQALYTDPSRENFIRALITNLVNLGRPDWARTHFISWRKKLDEEFGIHPTHETLLAFNQLVENQVNKISQI